jgi:predicted Zn-dependent protease
MPMRTVGWLRATTIVTLIVFCASCVTTKLPPISSAGAEFQPLKDEFDLWTRSREEEAKLRDNADLYQDPLLEDYLVQVAGHLNPESMAVNPEIDYTVTVIENPTLNAFAFPHGAIYVHTGLLARMENEDQLATVLGHEMTHVEYRHMLRHQRSAKNKQIGFSVGAVAAAVILAGEAGDAYGEGKYGKAARLDVLGHLMIGLGLQLAFIAAVNGYGRDLEREADEGGFAKMTASGYDIDEAPAIYQALLDDQGESGDMEVFFFGSHPKLASRIESANEWIDEHPDELSTPRTPRPDPDAFDRRIRPVIRDDARLNLERGRLNLAASQLDRVSDLMPEDPEVHLLIGMLELKRADGEKDVVLQREMKDRAAVAFREAIRLDPERPVPHRELGLLAYHDEDFEAACVQFRQYVELDPKAEDAGRIRDYVLELERDAGCP